MIPKEVLPENINSVILGLSGGADSVALLRLLHASGAELRCIHCNFHLRGAESMRDQAFCEKLCSDLGVSMEVVDFDVEKEMAERRVSEETACRDLRYTYFRKRLRETGAQRIAVAHNRDDQAETVLMNLFRGAGPRGIAGMRRDDGEIIRPLLGTSRAEIIVYLKELGQKYVTDSTNLESDYRRNFVRNNLFPLIEERWPAAKRKIAEAADIMRLESDAADFFTDQIAEDTDFLSWEKIKEAPSSEWIVTHFLLRAGGTREIAGEVADAVSAGGRSVGKWWRLDAGHKVTYERDGLHIIAESELPVQDIVSESFAMNEEVMARVKRTPLSELWLPLPPERVEFRRWRKGDRISPLGMQGSRLVSDILCEGKLTSADKQTRLVCVDKESGQLLWVQGLKRSRHALIRPTDTTVYRYKLIKR